MNDDELDLVTSWAEGWLTGAAARRAQDLADADPALAAHANWVRSLRQRVQGVVYSAPEPSVHDAVLALFTARAARPSLLRRVIATVTLDSRQQGLAGVRSPLNLERSRDQVFTTDQLDIAVTLTRTGDEVVVFGQLLDHGVGGLSATVQLMSGDEQLDATLVDDHGEFELTAGAGTVDLIVVVEGADTEIVVPLDLSDLPA
jgi:hypothetical protein